MIIMLSTKTVQFQFRAKLYCKIPTSIVPVPPKMPAPRFSLANSSNLLSLIVSKFLLSAVLSPLVSKAVHSQLVAGLASVKLSVPGCDPS